MVENKEKLRYKETLKCPECGSTRLIKDFDRAEIICAECGLVVQEEIIDTGPEWRVFESDDRNSKSRVGSPTTYTIHDKGLSTMIDWRNQDIYGKDLSPKRRAQIYRLRKWQRRIRVSDAMERNLSFALSELDRLASYLGLHRNIREDAAILYRKALSEGLIRGRSIESVTAACLYIICRQQSIPRTLDEIAEYSRVDKKEIGRSYRFLSKELGLSLAPTNPIDYIPRFASELGVSGKSQKRAIEILEEAMNEGLTSGRGPMGVAAGALYIANIQCNERRTQKEISRVAKVTEVTIRNRYKELEEKLGIKVDV
ncbi:MAG: transcription initiation factor IIB [Methanomicrobia archaeon]|nr:transcription initiation factor IIB [Methanomicrobia archaeon]MCK4309929.1 transcription initiation factor IIB [Methanomicrobia archaeon]MCK4636931.1 transcription initiation factor IIB [Methanomicrobia archaeon]